MKSFQPEVHMTTRRFAVSMQTLCGLAGPRTILFDTLGITKTARQAHELGFGLQLSPFRGSAESFGNFLSHADDWGDEVVSITNPWFGKKRPLTNLSCGQLFLTRQQRISQLEESESAYPNAITIGCGKVPTLEVNPTVKQREVYWLNLARTGKRMVLDTYHLQHGWNKHDCGSCHFSSSLNPFKEATVLVQVHFRRRNDLDSFLTKHPQNGTTKLLEELRAVVQPDTPAVIKLKRGLVPPNKTAGVLTHIRKRTSDILDG
jgi:hypothetical protein